MKEREDEMNSEKPYEEIKVVHQAMSVHLKRDDLRGVVSCIARLMTLLDKTFIKTPTLPISGVYIIHDNESRNAMKETIIPMLYDNGYGVYSTWIWRDVIESYHDCMINVQDLMDSDFVLMFADQYGSRPDRKKFIEFGMALALGKKILVTGGMEERKCLYYYHPGVVYVRAAEGLIGIRDTLDKMRQGEKVHSKENGDVETA